MSYEIILSTEAAEDFRRLDAGLRAVVRAGLDKHLRDTPTKLSKSRIKRLRGMSRPQYRLRLDPLRIFYDVSETNVEVLAIILKSDANKWLEEVGETNEESTSE